jgi:uncharacterized repeat protein (TIGR03803 family)
LKGLRTPPAGCQLLHRAGGKPFEVQGLLMAANFLFVLIADSSGNLFGTTYQGGQYNYGTVFELVPSSP